MEGEHSEYSRAGWHEFLLPATSERGGTEFLRIWVEAAGLFPSLRRLAPDDEHRGYPDLLNASETTAAQQAILRQVTEHVFAHPETVRRVSTTRRFAGELWERFRIGPSPHSLPYPPVIDQADLDPAKVCLALPFIIDRAALSLPARGGLP